jgi:predicted RNA binding protein YcfA (HicA-like mRNA interferase family)
MASVETNTRRIIARLEREGWVRQTGGKHDKFKHPTQRELIVVPRHREQSPGVARSIAKAAGWI